MTPRPLILAAALAALILPARADAQVIGPDRLTLIEGFATLEATVLEAGRAGLFAVLPGLPEESRASAATDYVTASAAMEERIAAMQAVALDGPVSQVLGRIETNWQVLSREGATLIEQADDSEGHRAAVLRWREGLEGLDDVIDIALESLLTGQEIEG
jgi:hypothetical protein